MLRIFDSHAHYDDQRFDEVCDSILTYEHESCGVELVLNAASSINSCKTSMLIAERNDHVYFAAGVHPESAHTDSLDDKWLNVVEQYISHPKCKAVGEIGLDYYYGKETESIQKEVFRAQMMLAKKYELPVIIHDREAHGDTIGIISEFPEVVGVFHSFSGSCEMARDLLKKGWYISFNGIITFKNARKSVEVLDAISKLEDGKYLDRILVETDAPYLSPVPNRGKTNTSSNIQYTAQKCADIIGITIEEFCELTYKNACKFFNIQADEI